ncbi:MAG TPA: 50S ribosomal protein L6 [Polyangiaceae bacterium]|nr:50S ribosomal protein L6 [Polyangiaceae bacterium]
MTTQVRAQPRDGESIRQSRTGKRPIVLPKGITAALKSGTIEIKGPKATLARAVPTNVEVKVDGATIRVTPTVSGRDGARFQGLARSLLAGMVAGVADGYTKTLQLVGTGYRAELKGQTLNLSLGFSHPIAFPLPKGVKCEIPGDSKGTIVILTGADKEVMGQTAAKIRAFRPPEPYGGKGVRYQGEKVREKAGKAAKAGGGK